jgi:Family of unknown function (DUF5343)
MPLTNAYVQGYGKIPELFQKIRDGHAPDQFTHQLLKDWGFASSNDRQFIPLLKALGFLSPDGKPTSRYHDYRDHSRSKAVMGDALREAYSDIFLIKSSPTKDDKDAIQGKFKSFHNAGDRAALLMTSTFLSLLSLADVSGKPKSVAAKLNEGMDQPDKKEEPTPPRRPQAPALHYNIQIHLPATKDIEVYNAIFKSLKDHLYET